MELNTGLTAFADNQSDGSKSHIERYHRYDFDTKEESIEEIIVETNSFTDGETTAGYFPNGKISDIDLSDLYAIIGSNDITVVDNPTATPYCSTVCLQITTNNGGTNYGSGFMIGPNALATAAHNLYSIKEKAYVKSVNVAPARSDNSKPFGSENVSASSMIVSDSYLAGTSSEDWAIITLKNNLGTKTGWLGLHWQSSNYSSSQLVYAYGYPSQINGADARYRMCKSSGYIRSQTSKYLKGDWDLTGGFSGGPLVEYISGAGYVAIGIHKDGSTIDGSSYSKRSLHGLLLHVGGLSGQPQGAAERRHGDDRVSGAGHRPHRGAELCSHRAFQSAGHLAAGGPVHGLYPDGRRSRHRRRVWPHAGGLWGAGSDYALHRGGHLRPDRGQHDGRPGGKDPHRKA